MRSRKLALGRTEEPRKVLARASKASVGGLLLLRSCARRARRRGRRRRARRVLKLKHQAQRAAGASARQWAAAPRCTATRWRTRGAAASRLSLRPSGAAVAEQQHAPRDPKAVERAGRRVQPARACARLSRYAHPRRRRIRGAEAGLSTGRLASQSADRVLVLCSRVYRRLDDQSSY